MKLIKLVVQGFVGLEDSEFSFLDEAEYPNDVILVTGGPRSGKSSFLRAIAMAKEGFAAYGVPPDLEKFLRPGCKGGKLHATWLLNDLEADFTRLPPGNHETVVEFGDVDETNGDFRLRRLFSQAPKNELLGKMELFGSNRDLCLDKWRFSSYPISDVEINAGRLHDSREKYLPLARVFYECASLRALKIADALERDGIVMASNEADPVSNYKSAIESILPDLHLSGFEIRGFSAFPVFIDKNDRKRPIEVLSPSEQQAVLFASWMKWNEINNSIILINSPETHHHFSEHVQFLRGIAGLGESNQIFATTQSEDLTDAFPDSSIVNLDTKR